MKPSLREVLAVSHIASVTIAVLLVWSLDSAFRALWEPLSRIASFLFTALAIFDIPYFSISLNGSNRFTLITTSSYLLAAVISFASAWLVSRWVYGVGPLRSLGTYRSRLVRRYHV